MHTTKQIAKNTQVLQLLRRMGIIRPRDARAHGLPGEALWQLARRGLLEQRGRGIYAMADHKYTEHHSLAEAAKRVPHGTICLLSALRAHNLNTQSPHEVWIAVDRKARLSTLRAVIGDRKSTRLNSSHSDRSRMPSSA